MVLSALLTIVNTMVTVTAVAGVGLGAFVAYQTKPPDKALDKIVKDLEEQAGSAESGRWFGSKGPEVSLKEPVLDYVFFKVAYISVDTHSEHKEKTYIGAFHRWRPY